MEDQNYKKSITVQTTPKEVFNKVCRVSEWWANDASGKSENINDIFTVRFKNGDSYTCKISEIVPNEKIVWDVIDSYQGWHEKHAEWNGTKIIWEIISKNSGTELRMTHVGLVPEFECYTQCNQGWNYLITKSLQQLLQKGIGMPV